MVTRYWYETWEAAEYGECCRLLEQHFLEMFRLVGPWFPSFGIWKFYTTSPTPLNPGGR